MLGKRIGKQRPEEGAHLFIAEDVGNAHFGEAHLLHIEEAVEQPVDLLAASRLDTAEAADGLELARLRAVLLALALAGRAGEQRLKTAIQIDRERKVRARKIGQRGKRIGGAVEIGQQPLQRNKVDVRPRLGDCREQRADRRAVDNRQKPRVGGGEIAVGVTPAGKTGNAEGAISDDFQCQRERRPAFDIQSSDHHVGLSLGRPIANPGCALRRSKQRRGAEFRIVREAGTVARRCRQSGLARGGRARRRFVGRDPIAVK